MEPEDLVTIPQDLSLVPDKELAELESAAVQEFDRVNAIEDFTEADLAYAQRLTEGIDRIRPEMAARKAKAQSAADAARFQAAQQKAAMAKRVHGDDAGGEGGSAPAPAPIDADAIVAAASRGVAETFAKFFGEPGRPGLAAARQFAPRVVAPGGKQEPLAVTASVDIPGVASGAKLSSLDEVVGAFQRRARALPISADGRADGGPRVVTIRDNYQFTLDDRTSPATFEEMLNRLITNDTKEALVAGGGWCAPSENLYSFFNVTCTDGLIDLPTIGVSRGGIKYPTSPSLADVFTGTFTNATNPWLWTETDDINTVTGSTNKPCVRVPCPAFNENRLECYGICLTAGNLTDDAYPEATANYLRLLLAAHQHAMNMRTINLMIASATAIVTGADFNVDNLPVTNQVLGSVALASMDYRARYGMCDDDVLEVVFPLWLREMIRSDLAWRTKVDKLAVTNAEIDNYFRVRRIAPQWVSDYQIRGASQPGYSTIQSQWPDTVDFMLYAPGTFVRGNGLTLDLGVVRDSVLNAENDHTAAWTEQCHLIAKVGYEARQYRVAISVSGAGNADATFADRL